MPREEAYGLTVSTTRVREFAEVLGAAGAGKFEGHAVGWRRDRFPAVLRPRGTRCDTGSGPLRPAFPHGSIGCSLCGLAVSTICLKG
jgi:hypothetical protein